jgi:membrane protease YdiL (CAAX protease family)
MSIPPYKIWLCVIPAMILPCIASFFYFILLSDSLWGRWIYAGTKFFTLIWPLIVIFFIFKGNFLSKLKGSLRKHLQALPLGIALGLSTVALMYLLLQFSGIQELLKSSAGSIHKKAENLGILEHYWLFAIFLAVFHSLLEEYYWRWFVFRHLKLVVRLPLAHFLAALAFASHHIVVTTQFFPFVWVVFSV